MIKRISNELVDRYEKSFTIDFEQNKQFLKEIGLDVSKKLRNKIAGYIAHSLVKMKKLHSIKVTYQNPNLDKRKKARRD